MTEIKKKVGRKPRPHTVNEIQSQEAIVAFYESRLDEALEKLGRLIAVREERISAGFEV